MRKQDEYSGVLRRDLIRQWFFAGLLVWVPLGGTLLVLRFLFNLLDVSVLLIPPPWRPAIPGLGVVLSLALVIGTGAFLANYLGAQFIAWLENQLQRVPFVRSLYGGMKKLAENVFSENSSAFNKVVLIEWPRKGMWSVGFEAGAPVPEIVHKVGQDIITVFIPTTPNPTSGFIMSVPRDEVRVLDMSIEEGMRYIISLGVVAPGHGAATGSGAAAIEPPPVPH